MAKNNYTKTSKEQLCFTRDWQKQVGY